MNKKHRNTEAEKNAQKARTRANKRAKYKALIENEPSHKDISIWKEKMAKIPV